MQVSAINNNYRSPNFGVRIRVANSKSPLDLKSAIQQCPNKEDLNNTLNTLLNAAKIESHGNRLLGDFINLGVDEFYRKVPKDDEPFLGYERAAEQIDDKKVEFWESPRQVLYVSNPVNGLELCIDCPKESGAEEVSAAMYKLLSELVKTDLLKNKLFWERLTLKRLYADNEPLDQSPEKHKIFSYI